MKNKTFFTIFFLLYSLGKIFSQETIVYDKFLVNENVYPTVTTVNIGAGEHTMSINITSKDPKSGKVIEDIYFDYTINNVKYNSEKKWWVYNVNKNFTINNLINYYIEPKLPSTIKNIEIIFSNDKKICALNADVTLTNKDEIGGKFLDFTKKIEPSNDFSINYSSGISEVPYRFYATELSDFIRYNEHKALYNQVEEVIEIPNMPRFKNQAGFGACRQYSLWVVLQKFFCDYSKSSLKSNDCRFPYNSHDISAFGLSEYADRVNDNEFSFNPDAKEELSMPQIIENIQINENGVLLESSRAWDKFTERVNSANDPVKEKEKIMNYLKWVYENYKTDSEDNIKDISKVHKTINENFYFYGEPIDNYPYGQKSNDLYVTERNLKKALTKSTYEKFLYIIFFRGCNLMPQKPNFVMHGFPYDNQDVQPVDIKNKIIEVLKQGIPVLFTSLAITKNEDNTSKSAHSTIISGYKKVCNDSKCVELFKIHNSYGEIWQKLNNDGWVDAENFVNNTDRIKVNGKVRIASASIIWLTPQP